MPSYPRTGAVWNQRFYDTYAGYASQNAFELAYPNIFTFDTFPNLWTSNHSSVFFATWGATNGPGSVPGVRSNKTANHHTQDLSDSSYGGFQRTVAGMTGTEFRAVGRFTNEGYTILAVGYYTPESSPGAEDDSTTLIVTVATGKQFTSAPVLADYDDLGIRIRSPLTSQAFAGQWPLGTTADIEIQGQVGASGYIRLLFNGTELYLYEGLVNGEQADFLDVSPGGRDSVENGGRVTNVGLYDVLSASPLFANQSTSCCGLPEEQEAVDHGGGIAGPVLGPDPFAPLPEWVASCAGGGDFPDGTDDTNAEVWD